MNQSDFELFQEIESAWVLWVFKAIAQGEIPFLADTIMGRMVTYLGDLPQSGAYKPDIMPATMDKYRQFTMNNGEAFVARMMFLLPNYLQLCAMWPPLALRQPDNNQALPNREKIALQCGLSVDVYKKRRAKIKHILVLVTRTEMLRRSVRDRLTLGERKVQ